MTSATSRRRAASSPLPHASDRRIEAADWQARVIADIRLAYAEMARAIKRWADNERGGTQ
jgi:hypothetical protein